MDDNNNPNVTDNNSNLGNNANEQNNNINPATNNLNYDIDNSGSNPYEMNNAPFDNSNNYQEAPEQSSEDTFANSINNAFNNINNDPYESMNPDPNFNNSQILNPILSQNINSTSDSSQNASNNDMNFDDTNMNYQDNVSDNNNMNYQDNSFDNNNMNYQDNTFNNNNMNYQDNSFDNSNMNYQDNTFNNSNMNYQNNGFDNSNMDSNLTDPNLNYQSNNINENQTSNSMNYNSTTDYTTDFIKNWMGNLYEKTYKNKFNWCAALLGPAYLLFRKMYTTGLLFTILTFLIILLQAFIMTKVGLLALPIAAIIWLILIIFYGFAFYPLYKSFVNGKLNKLKQSITDNSQLVNTAKNKGNTSTLSVILYCILFPVIVFSVLSLIFGSSLFDFEKNNSNMPQKNETSNQEVLEDLQYLNFVDNYSITYDSISWFFDETNNSLIKGSYTLTYSGQSVPDLTNTFRVDATTPTGRSNLLETLVSSYEAQAAVSNLSVERGQSNFVRGTNAYYGFLDVISSETIERYFLVLIPEDDIIFQFVLTTNDTTIDYETNLQVINILTSIERLDGDISQTDETENLDDENIPDNTLTSENVVDENVAEENIVNASNDIIADEITNENTVPTENDVADENTASENAVSNVTANSQNVVSNLSDFLS